jgi:hypothetical protein
MNWIDAFKIGKDLVPGILKRAVAGGYGFSKYRAEP